MNACTKLEEVTLKFIVKHFRKIIAKGVSGEFNELSCAELEELIAHDELNMSEENAFKAIVKWISSKPDIRSQNMGELSCIFLKKLTIFFTGAKIQFQLCYYPNFGLVYWIKTFLCIV